MIVFSGLAAVLGVALFQTALGMTVRANPAARIPFWRNAETIPAGSVVTRAIGAGLLVFGAAMLGTVAWYWPLIVVLAGPGVALATITIHNARIARHGAAAR